MVMNNNYEQQIMLRNKRSIALTIATRTGIKEVDSWEKFNNWMLKRSVLKKELYRYNLDELDLLIKQFRALEKNHNNTIIQLGIKAWLQKNKHLSFNQN
ncbi:hypothetical protein GCM10010984_03770 [Chishuiella changwenlii]|uniref:Uncharacterized protein n=2 Tax=Chishuiella changwenlii TaxID=1434701 RepID=A0ABQ1TB16_9FLAO|nr:hypothetical protein GCM10010984_03770 [Chishuiella changwenlii]